MHPDDKYAWEHEQQKGKTKLWYVLDAKPKTMLVHGLAHNITKEQLKQAIETGQLSKHLQKTEVHKGDVFFIPAGIIHAIGAGALIAEIQENSNVTYRVYDYNRVDKDGKKRELLCRCQYFEVERVQVSKGVSFSVHNTSFQVMLCLNGSGGIGRCHVMGETEFLKIRC